MLRLVGTITLNIFSLLYTIRECGVFPLLAVFVLRDIEIYICTSNSYDVASNIEVPIDQLFYFLTTLNIPNIYPNNGYIQFGKNFDNVWF